MISILLIVFSLSIDAFVVSLAYGANKTRFSLTSKVIITAISSLILMLSILIGSTLRHFIPHQVTVTLCVFLLCGLGIARLLEYLIKHDLSRRTNRKRTLSWNVLSIQFNLTTSLPAAKEDPSLTPHLGIKESICLGTALSLDSIAVGIGIGMMSFSLIGVFFASLMMNLLMLSLGNLAGYYFSRKFNVDLGWLSGIILILLAFSKLT